MSGTGAGCNLACHSFHKNGGSLRLLSSITGLYDI